MHLNAFSRSSDNSKTLSCILKTFCSGLKILGVLNKLMIISFVQQDFSVFLKDSGIEINPPSCSLN